MVVAAAPRAIDPRDEFDRREVCRRHGWVGRRAFVIDRHDLCEVRNEEETDVDNYTSQLPALVPELVPGKKRRLSVRERGIPRKKTLSVRHILQLDEPAPELDFDYDRPQTRADCTKCPVCQLVRDHKSNGHDKLARVTTEAIGYKPSPRRSGLLACGHRSDEVIFRSRPCVMVGCKQALYLDVNTATGSITLNFPHLEPWELAPDRSCSLDLTERGGMTLDEVGEITSLTRERVRQIEARGLVKLIPLMEQVGIDQRDAAEVGRRLVGPSADLEEAGVTGEMPGELTYLPGGS